MKGNFYKMESDLLNQLLFAFEEMTGFADEQTPLDGTFDRIGFEQRSAEYKTLLRDRKMTTLFISEKLNIPIALCEFEIHLYIMLNPGRVLLKFLSIYFKASFREQKNIDALQWMKENIENLTLDYICDRLNVSEKVAHEFVREHKMKVKPKKSIEIIGEYVFKDMVEDGELKKKIIQYYNTHPYTPVKKAIKDMGIKIREHVFSNGLEEMVNMGMKIPCLMNNDPIAHEKLRRDVIQFKEKNMYATPKILAAEFGITEKQVIGILYNASEEYRQEKIRSYELYFKRTLEELDEVGDLCMNRFLASPQSSSRWLEIRQMGIEKKIRMLGLNAPTEVLLNQNVNVKSKEEKDAIVDAYFATEEIVQKQLPKKIN